MKWTFTFPEPVPRGAGRFAPGFLPGTARIVLFAAKTGCIFLFSFNGDFLS